jgi:hypothetical protein
MKWTKIYWDQLRNQDVFRIKKYNGTTSEEYVAIRSNPRRWEVLFEPWVDGVGKLKNLSYRKMGGFCEVLK